MLLPRGRRYHHAIGGDAGDEYELLHSFTEKDARSICVLIENDRRMRYLARR